MSEVINKDKDNFELNLEKKKSENIDNFKNKYIRTHSILSILSENKLRKSIKTLDSNSLIHIRESDITKFDELNNSLSNISNFDLEKGEDENDSFSFNSLKDYDDQNEENIIITHSKLNYHRKDEEYELELDKEFEEIEKTILMNKN